MLQRTRVGAYAVITHGSSVLLTKLAAGADRGLWSLPGGGIEHGEAPEEALARELREETGAQIHSPVLFATVTSRALWEPPGGESEDVHYVGIVFRAQVSERASVAETGDGQSCAGARWVDFADLPAFPLSKPARTVLEKAGLL